MRFIVQLVYIGLLCVHPYGHRDSGLNEFSIFEPLRMVPHSMGAREIHSSMIFQ